MLLAVGVFCDRAGYDDYINFVIVLLLVMIENIIELWDRAKCNGIGMKGQNGLVSWDSGQGILDVVKSLAVSEVAEGIVVPAIDMGIEDTG